MLWRLELSLALCSDYFVHVCELDESKTTRMNRASGLYQRTGLWAPISDMFTEQCFLHLLLDIWCIIIYKSEEQFFSVLQNPNMQPIFIKLYSSF